MLIPYPWNYALVGLILLFVFLAELRPSGRRGEPAQTPKEGGRQAPLVGVGRRRLRRRLRVPVPLCLHQVLREPHADDDRCYREGKPRWDERSPADVPLRRGKDPRSGQRIPHYDRNEKESPRRGPLARPVRATRLVRGLRFLRANPTRLCFPACNPCRPANITCALRKLSRLLYSLYSQPARHGQCPKRRRS